MDARGRSGGRCQGAAIGGCSRSTDSKVRLGSAELDGTSGDDGELDVTSGDEGEVDGTSGDLGGSLELGRRGGAIGEVRRGSRHWLSWGGATCFSWSGMTRLRNCLNFQIGTVKKQHQIDKLDQAIMTGGKIAACSLFIHSYEILLF